MSIIGSFMGTDQANDLQQARTRANDAARTGYDTAQGDYNQAYDLYNPYAQTGGNAMRMYANATGVNGQGAYQGAVNNFAGDPFRQSNEDFANKALMKTFNARGGTYGGATALAAARGSLERGSTDWNNWLDRLNGQSGMGYAATGAQAGIRGAQAGLGYTYGNDTANRETSFGNAMAASRNTFANNLIGLGGTLTRGFTQGYGGATPFGNMASTVGGGFNAMGRGINYIGGGNGGYGAMG